MFCFSGESNPGLVDQARPQWDSAFNEAIEVPFAAKGDNLSFANVTPPLLRAGAMLAVLGDEAPLAILLIFYGAP
mgnify:CR=1 FL=1